MAEIAFAKGHGTGNDFVILPDDDGRLDLTAERVRRLCDRRFGIGGDGVLRVVPTRFAAEPEVGAQDAEWFMDYRNADGSIAEMCGNGIRVFAHFLRATGRITSDEFNVATRAGVRQVRLDGDEYEVSMGKAAAVVEKVNVSVGAAQWPALGVLVPNPHAVVFVDDLADAGDLRVSPKWSPAEVYPDAVNVEFVRPLAPRRAQMRVYERGVGETLSCGTGACAAAWALRLQAAVPAGESTQWQIEVPGGTVYVTQRADGELLLRGPAEIVASGKIDAAIWG